MKKYIVTALTCATLLTASSVAARELSVKEKEVIETVVKGKLKDPDSAKFTWQDYKGGSGYCAHVNAKNSHGGYAGNALIIASVKKDSSGSIISTDAWVHSGEMENLMKKICIDDGYDA